ncbi:hypothetical protein CALCODRAFT_510151 [Calocera cornea HHB12733]|uniref:Membrane insertase YidC/Oxa/ALB C-terminal domain-containing protein n=1 Tax=Calocera cornea HHB12733 TaxID=1353952 RepID=A0A165EQR5_9BASI|nr:hypothetical protein CALCODRAFT_510151 [Calocera cornea HHB12733]
MHFGDLSALGLGMGFTPVAWTREAFEIVAASTGLPMWASILVLTVLIRAALLPLVIPSQINSTRLNNIQPQMKEIQEAVKAKLKSGDKVAAAFEQQKIRAIMKAHDVSLGKSFMYPVAQGITSISCFFAFRQMSLAPVPQLLEGGTLWFKDLTQAAHIFSDHSIWWAPWTWLGIDAMWGLPMAATAAMWVNAKYGGDMGAPATMQMQNMRSIASGMVILFCFITLTQPQAVCLYFLLNNLLLLLQGWILSIRPVRDYFGIPARDAAPEVAPVKPFRWRDFPSKVRRFVSGKWVEDMMKAVPEEPKQNRPRVQRPREPIKWIDQADAQRLMQEHRKSEVKHPSSPAEAHHQVHQLERDRLAKDQAAIKANRTAIKQEGRIQRPKGKHMR